MAGKNIRKSDFDKIKALLNINLSNKEVGMVLRRSPATIGRIKKIKDWEEYKEIKAKYAKEVNMKKRNGKPKVEPEAGGKMTYPHIGSLLAEINTSTKEIVGLLRKMETVKKLEDKGYKVY